MKNATDDSRTEVIRNEEAARARAFGSGVTILCSLGLILAIVRNLPKVERIAVIIAVSILWIAGVSIWWRARDEKTFSRRQFRWFGGASALSALVLVHALGVFSPITVILVLGMAFFVQGRDTGWILPVSGTMVLAYAVSAILVATGVLADRGVWRTPGTSEYISMTIIVTSVMITQLVLARANHRALHNAIEKSHEAMRVARTREAQLDEANENLDLALRGGGGGGRLTGTTLGEYSVGELVGRGAMGEVYAASSPSRKGRVAIKVLRSATAFEDSNIAKRFVREADIARSVRGPNLVEVFDGGQAEADGSPYIVMELLEGRDLAAILREQPALSLSDVVDLVESVANGLAVLHAAGVVHRDLKPQNLFLAAGNADSNRASSSSSSSSWKILDYGVSKIMGRGTMTENQLVGTPGYMSPEQAEARDVDLRSDIFSLGAVAYRAITGRRAFSGPDTPQILYQVVHGTPTRPTELVPSLPRGIETALAKALAKTPNERYSHAVDFANALRAAMNDAPISSPAMTTISAPIVEGALVKERAWKAEPTTLTIPHPFEVKSERREGFKR